MILQNNDIEATHPELLTECVAYITLGYRSRNLAADHFQTATGSNLLSAPAKTGSLHTYGNCISNGMLENWKNYAKSHKNNLSFQKHALQ